MARAEHPVLDRADGRELVGQPGALVRCQDPAGRVGVEQAEGDVRPLDHVAEHLAGGLVTAGLEVGRDDEADIRADGRRVPGQLDGLQDVGARRAGLDQRSRLHGADLLHADLQHPLALGRRQRPVLADQASHPDPVMAEGAQAVPDEGAERTFIDALPTRTAEGRVERVDEPSQCPRSPLPGLACSCHVTLPGRPGGRIDGAAQTFGRLRGRPSVCSAMRLRSTSLDPP